MLEARKEARASSAELSLLAAARCSEMENTETNKEVVNNANVQIETDALGVKPKPLNGGTTANRQLMAHIGPIRASIASKLGVKLDHMRISSKMWNVLKELEAEDRINKVINSEKKKGICREVRGGNTYVVSSPQPSPPRRTFPAQIRA